MKLKKNPFPNGASIFVIPMGRLTQMDAEFDAAFVKDVLHSVPELGKEAKKHFILNNHLTLHNNEKPRLVTILNVLLQASRQRNHNLVQIIK